MSHATGAKKKPRIWPSEPGTSACKPAVRPEQHAVEQGYKRQETDEHDSDVHGELTAVDGAAAMAPMKFHPYAARPWDDNPAFGGGVSVSGPAFWQSGWCRARS